MIFIIKLESEKGDNWNKSLCWTQCDKLSKHEGCISIVCSASHLMRVWLLTTKAIRDHHRPNEMEGKSGCDNSVALLFLPFYQSIYEANKAERFFMFAAISTHSSGDDTRCSRKKTSPHDVHQTWLTKKLDDLSCELTGKLLKNWCKICDAR